MSARAAAADDRPRVSTFSSLALPNYRRYFTGQAISLCGTWMQRVAQPWLVYELSGSATAVGLMIAVQTLPVLLLGPYGGVVADRADKRRLLISFQTGLAVLALVLGALAVAEVVTVAHVYVMAGLLGILTAFEMPTRHAFVLELVGPDEVRNAVSLNSTLANVARAVGPAIAGIIIAGLGTGVCFLVNAVTFAAVTVILRGLDVGALQTNIPAVRLPGQVREGFRMVRASPELAVPLLQMILIGSLAYEFEVVLPVLATDVFGAGPEAFGWMTAALGVGAVIGGLFVAGRGRTGLRALARAAGGFGIAMGAAALAPTFLTELAALVVVGAMSVSFIAQGNSTVQLAAPSAFRGRVLALWQVAFIGSRPIGAPVIGAVTAAHGGRVGLTVGAVACLLASALGMVAIRRTAAPNSLTAHALNH